MLIGAIARPHGVKGDVQVVPFNLESPHWRPGTPFCVLPKHKANGKTDVVESGPLESLTIKRVSAGAKGRLVVWFDGLSHRDAAEAYKGAWLALSEDALGELAEDEFWYHEIAGWQVCTLAHELIGEVVRIVDGATDLLEIRPKRGGETFFIPMVDEFVIEVDRENAKIVIDPIEGLIP